ncbi:MAG: DapH/DapD/GlmU-related protein [Planctomycetota bacterium]|jgi:maltose O-acetyltransferase
MNKLKNYLYHHHIPKMFVNQSYTYLLNLLHRFLNLMPGIIRNGVFRLLLGKAGKGIYIDYNVYFKFPRLIYLSDRVSINRGVQFYPDYFSKSTITIGSDVRIGPNVCFYASGHNIEKGNSFLHEGDKIVIGNNIWIGGGAIVLAGVTIGDNSVVGAGSVVSRDVPANTVVAGVPAKEIRKRDLQ